MTKVRVPIPDVPLYLPDGATSPLPAPRWGSIASLIDGNDCNISFDELNPQLVKFLHQVNRGFTLSDLLKRYGHGTPAATPKDESEVQEIHPSTKSDEEQDAGVRDADVDKVDIELKEVSEKPAEVQWDEVSEDGYLADLNIAEPLKYDPFPSIHEDFSDRIEDLLSKVDLEDSVMGGVQNCTMLSLTLHAMQEYGVTMQVEEGTQPLPATNSRRPDGRVRARRVPSPCRLRTAAVRMDVCAPGGYPTLAGYDSRRPDGRVSAPQRHPTQQHNTPSGHTGEQEPGGPGRRTRNTTHRAGTPVNRSREAQDAAHATQHTERAHR